MFIGNNRDYKISVKGELYDVKEIPEDKTKMLQGTYYIVADYAYLYIGKVSRGKDIGAGQIGYINSRNEYHIREYDYESEKDDFYISQIKTQEDFEKELERKPIADELDEYLEGYRNGQNIMKDNHQKVVNSSGVYIPDLESSDGPLTRIVKKMILHKKLVQSEGRASCGKDYAFDNLKNALTGNITITKFLDWCGVLETEWAFTVYDNGMDDVNPLGEELRISSKEGLTCDFGEHEKGIYKVELNDEDDPLKRLIKVAIIKKHININAYKDKGSTPYLINNMRSALKSKSKMMVPYFINWCEILGLEFKLRIINPEDGTFFEADPNYDASDYSINDTEM